MMRALLAGLLALHGMIHVLGFIAALIAPVPRLRFAIGRGAGLLWLVATLLFVTASVMVAAAPRLWWIPALAGLALSQALISSVWGDAKLGTAINVVLLAPVVFAMLAGLPGSLSSRYRAALTAAPPAPAAAALTEAHLAPLPAPVQAWLRRSGAVGKPVPRHVQAHFRGEIRSKVDGPWMPFTATQDDWFDPPRRIFFLEASMSGVPFEALHVYADAAATMEVKAAAVATMVDARGPQLSRSETVTFFNDLAVLAPGALAAAAIAWEPIDALHARGTLTHGGYTVSAVLTFDAGGDLIDFTSTDRLQTEDGVAYHAYPWTTPMSEHRDYGGVRLARRGEARWLMPAGPLTYGRFELLDLHADGAP